MAVAQLTRDPFARTTLMRESRDNPGPGAIDCGWCGQRPKRLYRYYQQDDSGRGAPRAGAPWFCNKGCADDYAG